MGYSIAQWRRAITKLLELTSEDAIKWEPSSIFEGDAWTLVDECLAAGFSDKTYTISKTRSKHYLDEVEFVWDRGYDLSIFTGSKVLGFSLIASCPDSISLETLFEKAKGNLAFNANALGDLLGD